MLLAALGDRALASELEGSWRAAGEWLAGALERGGGFVRCAAGTWGALSQQGWRDAIDPVSAQDHGGILRADGTAPASPLADVDSQAAAHAGLRALARLSGEDRWERLAAELRERLGALGCEAMAVEPDGTIVPGAGSQLGWLLWADALDGAARDAAVDAPVRARRALRVRAAHPVERLAGVRAAGTTTAARCGPSTPGSGGAACAPPGGSTRPNASAVACCPRWSSSAARRSSTRSRSTGRCAACRSANRVQAWTVGAMWALRNGWDGRPGRRPSTALGREAGEPTRGASSGGAAAGRSRAPGGWSCLP